MRLAETLLLAHFKDSESANIKTKRHGLKITIENPKGTKRKLYNDDGEEVYNKHMFAHYGYLRGTKGRDGAEVDCFLGPVEDAKEVYIVDMIDKNPDKDNREDEDKTFIGFPSAEAAKQAFLLHYDKSFYGGMTALPIDVFKKRLKTASKPYRRKKITAVERTKCPHCGSTKFSLMPTDFETAKCARCGKNFQTKAYLPSKSVHAGGPGSGRRDTGMATDTSGAKNLLHGFGWNKSSEPKEGDVGRYRHNNFPGHTIHVKQSSWAHFGPGMKEEGSNHTGRLSDHLQRFHGK